MDANEKPLNVAFRSDEDIGKWMSNFSLTPFVLDGVEFASVEAFYVYLKLDPATRDAVRTLWGVRAKNAGKKSKLTRTSYLGKEFDLGSPEHFELVKRAIRAKLEAYPDMAKAFVATSPRTIVHDTGYAENPATRFPGAVFCRILTELREEFAATAA